MQLYEMAAYDLGVKEAWEKFAGVPRPAVKAPAVPAAAAPAAPAAPAVQAQVPTPGKTTVNAPSTPNATPGWGQRAMNFMGQHADTILPVGMMVGGTMLANSLFGNN
jgi:hypothetical protein